MIFIIDEYLDEEVPTYLESDPDSERICLGEDLHSSLLFGYFQF